MLNMPSRPAFRSLVLASSLGLASAASAQQVLPFPPTPSGSLALPTMRESTYRPLPAPKRLPKDAPNVRARSC